MEKFKRVLKRIFCLPPLATVSAAIFGFGFVIAVAIFKIESPAARYAAYLASAYALIVTCTGIVYVKPAVVAVKKYVSGRPLMKKLRSTRLGGKYLTDARFRAGVSLYQGFFINLLYIAMKLVSGIVYRSAWFIALAVYYILLAVMRLMLARRLNARDEAEELRRYRLCGIMLLFTNCNRNKNPGISKSFRPFSLQNQQLVPAVRPLFPPTNFVQWVNLWVSPLSGRKVG